MLDLDAVAAFVAVVETGGFHAAARRLGVSQPAVTQKVRRLEQSLGVLLLDRHRRGCVPTAAGAAFLARARRALEAARRAETVFAGRSLVVGAATNPGIYLLPKLIGPGVELRLGTNPETVERLECGEVDLAVLEWWDDRPGFEAFPWREEPLIGIVPPGHRFAGRDAVPLAEFLAEPLIGGEPGTGTARLLAEALQGAPLPPPARVMGSTDGVKRAVAAGLGVSVVLACAVRDEIAAGSLVPVKFSGAVLRRRFFVVLPDGLPETAPEIAFLHRLRNTPDSR
ncbi:MAG: LysR family transcriptional regulator [Elioraea sp.]|nr:LysR family transcriptional regulator [Elioraea sp.]MDW8443289.1 LysR family transcriptional regulator [Acetobacteraceae bacterium]